jgi:hypothetical protein
MPTQSSCVAVRLLPWEQFGIREWLVASEDRFVLQFRCRADGHERLRRLGVGSPCGYDEGAHQKA